MQNIVNATICANTNATIRSLMTQYRHKYLDVGIGAELGGRVAGVAVFVIILKWINRCFTDASRD